MVSFAICGLGQLKEAIYGVLHESVFSRVYL